VTASRTVRTLARTAVLGFALSLVLALAVPALADASQGQGKGQGQGAAAQADPGDAGQGQGKGQGQGQGSAQQAAAEEDEVEAEPAGQASASSSVAQRPQPAAASSSTGGSPGPSKGQSVGAGKSGQAQSQPPASRPESDADRATAARNAVRTGQAADTQTTCVAWLGHGDEHQAEGSCSGWHFVLTPGGGNIIHGANLSVMFESGATTTVTGEHSGRTDQGAWHFWVGAGGDRVEAASASVSFTAGVSESFLLVISDADCAGAAAAGEVADTEPRGTSPADKATKARNAVRTGETPPGMTGQVSWRGHGDEHQSADPVCVGWHFVLTPGGGNVIHGATLDVTFQSGETTTVTGQPSGDTDQGAWHFRVSAPEGDVVQSATASFTFSPAAADNFLLVISDTDCGEAVVDDDDEVAERIVVIEERIEIIEGIDLEPVVEVGTLAEIEALLDDRIEEEFDEVDVMPISVEAAAVGPAEGQPAIDDASVEAAAIPAPADDLAAAAAQAAATPATPLAQLAVTGAAAWLQVLLAGLLLLGGGSALLAARRRQRGGWSSS
jgi:hypothetical protein